MSTPNKTWSLCRECHQKTWHTLVTSISRQEIEVPYEPNNIVSENTYDLLQCCGCECVTLRRTSTCEEIFREEKVTHFPAPSSRREPAWWSYLPLPAGTLLFEVYAALQAGSMRLAVMGARTLVDMAIIDKVGDVGTFEQKLESLESQGFVSRRNREVLDAALDAGNATAHRGHKFKPDEVNQVMDIVENLLQAIYVLEPAASKIKAATPPRKRAAK